MRALDLITKHLDLSGRTLHRALAEVWQSTYKGELDGPLPDWETDEIRAYLQDVDPGDFAVLLRVAYRHGVADGGRR